MKKEENSILPFDPLVDIADRYTAAAFLEPHRDENANIELPFETVDIRIVTGQLPGYKNLDSNPPSALLKTERRIAGHLPDMPCGYSGKPLSPDMRDDMVIALTGSESPVCRQAMGWVGQDTLEGLDDRLAALCRFVTHRQKGLPELFLCVLSGPAAPAIVRFEKADHRGNLTGAILQGIDNQIS